jgi:hypothetical protein
VPDVAGRKRNADPNLYSTSELAQAVNIAPRNVILLCERGDLPTVLGGGGPGQHRLLDIAGFSKAVVIGAFADVGLPLSEGVKIANAIWSYRPRQLPQLLADYLAQQWLVSTAFSEIPGDMFAIIYNGRHLIFRKDDRTIVSFPNYLSVSSNQAPSYHVEPHIAGSPNFVGKKWLFEHLLKHARVQVKVNISQSLRRAALQMQTIKLG